MHSPSAELGAIHQTDDPGFNGKRITEGLDRFFLVTEVGDELHVSDVVPGLVYAGRDATTLGSSADLRKIPLSARLGRDDDLQVIVVLVQGRMPEKRTQLRRGCPGSSAPLLPWPHQGRLVPSPGTLVQLRVVPPPGIAAALVASVDLLERRLGDVSAPFPCRLQTGLRKRPAPEGLGADNPQFVGQGASALHHLGPRPTPLATLVLSMRTEGRLWTAPRMCAQ